MKLKKIFIKRIFWVITLLIILNEGRSQEKKDLLLLDKYNITNLKPQNYYKDSSFNFDNIRVEELGLQDLLTNPEAIKKYLWLEKPAKENKVVLLGETHYSGYIKIIETNIVFALNTFDYYPLVVLEDAYSLSAYYNYYVNKTNDSVAISFLNHTLGEFINTYERIRFLESIRQWNKHNPKKKIEIGCSDLEFNGINTTKILYNYYKDFLDKNTLDRLFSLPLIELIIELDNINISDKDTSKQILTSHFVKNIFKNVNSTYTAYELEFSYYRQKSIIRNLTSSEFYGKYFNEKKVILIGGADHMITHFEYPDGANFFKEGCYLNFDYAPVKGKVYSIYIEGYSIVADEILKQNIDSCFRMGIQYKKIFNRLSSAYSDGLLQDETGYFLFGAPTKIEELFLAASNGKSYQPILIKEILWDNVEYFYKSSGINKISLLRKKDKISQYDSYIVVPQSPMTRIIKKNSILEIKF